MMIARLMGVDGNDDSADDVMEPGTAFSTSYVELEGGVQ